MDANVINPMCFSSISSLLYHQALKPTMPPDNNIQTKAFARAGLVTVKLRRMMPEIVGMSNECGSTQMVRSMYRRLSVNLSVPSILKNQR